MLKKWWIRIKHLDILGIQASCGIVYCILVRTHWKCSYPVKCLLCGYSCTWVKGVYNSPCISCLIQNSDYGYEYIHISYIYIRTFFPLPLWVASCISRSSGAWVLLGEESRMVWIGSVNGCQFSATGDHGFIWWPWSLSVTWVFEVTLLQTFSFVNFCFVLTSCLSTLWALLWLLIFSIVVQERLTYVTTGFLELMYSSCYIFHSTQ